MKNLALFSKAKTAVYGAQATILSTDLGLNGTAMSGFTPFNTSATSDGTIKPA